MADSLGLSAKNVGKPRKGQNWTEKKKDPHENQPYRLTIMRIRFQASDFGLVAKINLIRAKSKQASCAEMVLGSFVFLLV